MMTNLFSSFDPSTNLNTSLNWISTIIGLITIPSLFWFIPSRLNFMWTKLIITLHQEFKILISNKKSQGSTLILISLFSIILFNNFMGLFPYIFTSTSHMALTLTLALPLWLTFMIYGWINNTTHMLAHLVPQGTPPVLMPFMVCIETISNMIRPGTLAIRLSANMIAGHLLMTLLGNTGSSLSLVMINLLIITQIILLILESAVAIIQSYVFAVLTTLYSSEVN
uniref:ATP synthase subunit a n=1 Tax=Cryptocephalus vittatus TaxID=1425562 RepID=A0A343C2I2_9CUCU|nr:ATP synthase F0 subunit 6 [Cryptocephalus vittatus]ARH54225.1 ATP synthase F0 subunit 6 [Cryptocephalus vittatus]